MNCNAIYAFREDAQDGPMAAGKSSNMFGEISLACIIRERPASDEFARHKIAEEDDGSVKLLCRTLRQALQAYAIKAATIFRRGFPLWSVGSGENGNSSGERSLFYPGEAPSSIAMCRKVVRNGNDCGKCMAVAGDADFDLHLKMPFQSTSAPPLF